MPHYYWSCMTIPFNICSRNPVLVVPAGFASNGVPVGMQIVGRRYDDVTPFRIGAALERGAAVARRTRTAAAAGRMT